MNKKRKYIVISSDSETDTDTSESDSSFSFSSSDEEEEEKEEVPWSCYLIQFSHPKKPRMYVGVTPTPEKRIRQHNKEIQKGAIYTMNMKTAYPQYKWEYVCITHGFTKRQALQFEWCNKKSASKWRSNHRHLLPKLKYQSTSKAIYPRLQQYLLSLNMPRWTKKAPPASSVPLVVEWWKSHMKPKPSPTYLPPYISETQARH